MPTVAVVYSIRDWNEHFECSQSRKAKNWRWVPTPLKHDGKSFRRLIAMPDGPALYGAWMLIVQIAAKCPVRGVLADEDGPLTTADFAIKTGCPQEHFDRTMQVLASKEVGWIVVEEWEGGGIALPLQDRTEQNKTNQPTNQKTTSLPEAYHDPTRGNGNGRMDGSFVLTWEAVGDRLAALSISNWRKAIGEAQACGCTPQHAHALIDYWQKEGRWKAGGLVWRFKHSNPQTPVERCWPEAGDNTAKDAAKLQAEIEKRRESDRRSAATALIKQCRKQGIVTDDAIKAELAKVGLEWPP